MPRFNVTLLGLRGYETGFDIDDLEAVQFINSDTFGYPFQTTPAPKGRRLFINTAQLPAVEIEAVE